MLPEFKVINFDLETTPVEGLFSWISPASTLVYIASYFSQEFQDSISSDWFEAIAEIFCLFLFLENVDLKIFLSILIFAFNFIYTVLGHQKLIATKALFSNCFAITFIVWKEIKWSSKIFKICISRMWLPININGTYTSCLNMVAHFLQLWRNSFQITEMVEQRLNF